MITAAKIISLLIIAEGALALFFPSLMLSTTEQFAAAAKAVQRRMGFFFLILGAALLYLTRLWLAEPLPHWVVAVTGVYMLVAGLFIVIFPGVAGKVMKWFYGEKKVTSLVGFILILGGSALLMLL